MYQRSPRRPQLRFSLKIATIFLVVGLVGAGCKKSGSTTSSSPGGDAPGDLSAELASYELLSGQPNRVLVGLFSQDGLLSYGTVDMKFSFLGTSQAGTSPQTGPSATGTFIIVPEEDQPVMTDAEVAADAAKAPAITLPTTARGVYQANDVVFDKPGYWQVEVSADVDGQTLGGKTSFEVVTKPSYPAVGEAAPATENMTLKSHEGASLEAVDSRSTTTGVPDPELHTWTVAKALQENRPIVVVVTTPLYCQSRFCGPITDEIAVLQEEFGDRAVFIHIEAWRNFQKKVLNKAAAEWVYRNEDLTEPWVFLIGSDGKIIDRWQNVLDRLQLQAELEKLPPMSP